MVAYSGDLLALDRLGNFVDLWLVAKKPQSLGGCRASSLTSETPLERNDFEHSQNHDDEEDKLASANNSGHYLADGLGLGSQPIYSCRWRSLTSQLQVGCGRLFNPLELARLGGANGPSVRLSKYKHLDGDSKHQTLPDSPRDEDQASGAACPACRCPLALLRPGGESLLLIEKN